MFRNLIDLDTAHVNYAPYRFAKAQSLRLLAIEQMPFSTWRRTRKTTNGQIMKALMQEASKHQSFMLACEQVTVLKTVQLPDQLLFSTTQDSAWSRVRTKAVLTSCFERPGELLTGLYKRLL